MQLKIKVIVAAVSLLTAFAVGRWACPAKIIAKTVTVDVEKKQTDTEKAKDTQTHTTVVETRQPDGTEEKTTTTDTNTTVHTDTQVTDNTTKSTETDKTVTYSKQTLTIMGLYGIPVTGGTPVYGGSVTKEILGPISIGLWGLSNATLGGSIGLTF